MKEILVGPLLFLDIGSVQQKTNEKKNRFPMNLQLYVNVQYE